MSDGECKSFQGDIYIITSVSWETSFISDGYEVQVFIYLVSKNTYYLNFVAKLM